MANPRALFNNFVQRKFLTIRDYPVAEFIQDKGWFIVSPIDFPIRVSEFFGTKNDAIDNYLNILYKEKKLVVDTDLYYNIEISRDGEVIKLISGDVIRSVPVHSTDYKLIDDAIKKILHRHNVGL